MIAPSNADIQNKKKIKKKSKSQLLTTNSFAV